MIVTCEYIFNNPKLDELSKIIKNTEHEHDEKYAHDEKRTQVICHVEFIDWLTNKTKNVKIIDYYIIFRNNRRKCVSNNRYVVNKANELIVIIEGEIKKNMLKTFI